MATTAVLDSNVFSFGFDIIDVIPALLKVVVEREYHHIAAGQAVDTVIHLVDTITTPGRKYPFTPAEAPTIQIYDPLDISILAATAMLQIGEGIFNYTHQTTTSYILGSYSAIFRCTNGTRDMITKKHVIFTIK